MRFRKFFSNIEEKKGILEKTKMEWFGQVIWPGWNDILNELKLELKLSRVLNEPSLNTHFTAWLEFKLDYLSSTYK
jgi:hypothetical protein